MQSERKILVSGGAGYIGSHVVHTLKQHGFLPIVLDTLENGHSWATYPAAAFYCGDIADAPLVREICAKHQPAAALHFAAFIEVGESVLKPEKYFANNRDKAKRFFDLLAEAGLRKIVFSSTAAVYGAVTGDVPITEAFPTIPINPYGQSKLDAETYLRTLPNVSSVTLRYFNVAGAAAEAGLGEAHFPESHLIPRLVLPFIDIEPEIRTALKLGQGFKIFGDDYPTPDGTAVRDYLHVLDLADAHVRALEYLLEGASSEIFNLGSGAGYSVLEVVRAARDVFAKPSFYPEVASRREGDPASLVASSEKARRILGWAPQRGIAEMIRSAAAWHRTRCYRDTILGKM